MDSSLTEKINILLRQVSLVDILRDGGYKITLRGGTKYLVQCPFHKNGQEENPSLSVDNEKGLYKCFTCGAKGNIITYLKEKNGMSFKDAIIYLGKRFSINVDDFFSKKSSKKAAVILESKRVNKLAMHFFGKKLLLKKENGYVYKNAVAYLKKRGIPFDIVKEFKIGYAPPLWDNLSLTLTKDKKADVRYLASLGLSKTKNGLRYFDSFINRIMFPIISEDGSVLGFGGRSIDGGEPKYINSCESIIFKKKYTLYGINVAKNHIMKSDMVILVEGYMDVIAMHKMGVKNVLGTLGTACTEYHIKLIKKYTKNVVLSFDSDDAGRSATNLAIRVCLKESVKPFIFTLSEAKDLDEYFSFSTLDDFNKLFEKRVVWYDYFINEVKKNSPGIEERMRHIEFIFSFIDLLEHATEREAVIAHMAECLSINKNLLVSDYEKKRNASNQNSVRYSADRYNESGSYLSSGSKHSYGKYQPYSQNQRRESDKKEREYNEEKEIIYLLTLNPQYIDFVEKALDIEMFNGAIAKELYARLLTIDKDKRTVENALLSLDNENIAKRIKAKADSPLYKEAIESKIVYGVKKMKERREKDEKKKAIMSTDIKDILEKESDINTLIDAIKKIQGGKKSDD